MNEDLDFPGWLAFPEPDCTAYHPLYGVLVDEHEVKRRIDLSQMGILAFYYALGRMGQVPALKGRA